MKRILSLLRNRNVVLLLALAGGLLLPQGAPWTYHLTLPALAVVMTLSTMAVPGSIFRHPRALIAPALVGVLMNYAVLAGFILVVSRFLIKEEEIWKGFVIIAMVPPGVAVIPFAEFLNGDKSYALFGMVGGYLGALVLMPLMSMWFLGAGFFQPGKLLLIMGELVAAPLLVSRLLLWTGLEGKIGPAKGTITNWSFFVVVYTVVGLNQDVFLHQPLRWIPALPIAVGSTFLLGWLIEKAGLFLKIDHGVVKSAVLLGTLKNYGLAGGIALALFGRQTAIPATVSTVFMIVYIIWLTVKKGESV